MGNHEQKSKIIIPNGIEKVSGVIVDFSTGVCLIKNRPDVLPTAELVLFKALNYTPTPDNELYARSQVFARLIEYPGIKEQDLDNLYLGLLGNEKKAQGWLGETVKRLKKRIGKDKIDRVTNAGYFLRW